MKTIYYFRKNIYGQDREYVANEKDAELCQRIYRQKSIDERFRKYMTELAGGMVEFKEILSPQSPSNANWENLVESFLCKD